MKTITTLLTPPETPAPDFSGKSLRLKLDQTVIVTGHDKLRIRPIQLDDEKEMIRFHKNISEESIYMRYFEYLGLDRRTSHERLCRICANTPESFAIVVERTASEHHPAAILAVGRLTKTSKPFVATFDSLMIDEEKETQLGKVLLNRLITLAQAFGFHVLTSDLLVDDHDSINLCRALGFSTQTLPKAGLVRATLDL
jgi:acetyltransferase